MVKYIYTPPEINVYNLSKLLLEQAHVLIGGTTGSGKSVLLNNLVSDAMMLGKQFYFIDLKGVELIDYKDIPSCIRYTRHLEEVEPMIDELINTMEYRYTQAIRQGKKMYDGNDIYLVIDEYVDIKVMSKYPKVIENKLMSLVSKGRASRIHVVLCTQRCTNDILSNNIKANFTCKVGLRTVSAQESRNIIGVSGCEQLEKYGHCYVLSPSATEIQYWRVEMYSDEELKERINTFIEYNNLKRQEERRQYSPFRLFGI